MDRENYIRVLEQRHRAYFDVYRNHPLGDRVMDLYAVFHLKNRRFFLTKVLDEYEVHEYRMVKCCDTLDFNFIREFGEWLKGQVKLLVRPDLSCGAAFHTGHPLDHSGLRHIDREE